MENFNLKKFLVENKLTTNSRILKEEQEDSLLKLIQAYVSNDYTIDQGYVDAYIEKAEQEQPVLQSKITQLKGEEYFNKVAEIANLLTSEAEYSGEDIPEIEQLAAQLGFTVDQIKDI